MATVESLYSPPTGLTLVNLSGSVLADAQFDVQPVAGDQILAPSSLTVSEQLAISGSDGAHTVHHIRADGTTYTKVYMIASQDLTAPVLSSPAASSTGTTTAAAQVVTDEAGGTLFYMATINATESQATVTGNGSSQPVTATGLQTLSLSGLAPGTTVYVHFVHRDAAGNDSLRVTSAAITTDAMVVTESGAVNAQLTVPSGYLLANLSGTVTTDSRFTTQPAAGDQILYPDTIAVDSQLNISAADGTYTLYHVTAAGSWTADSIAVSSNDSTAPSLSSPVATAAGETSLAVAVTTNEGNGTLYAYASANSSETDTAIINNGVAQGVSSTGQQAFTVSGLQAGTGYYVHFLHKDAAGNNSPSVTSSYVVTNDAGTGPAPGSETVAGTGNWTAGEGYTMVTLTSGFDPYVFEGWPTGEPRAGWQLVTWTADGYFDDKGNYFSELEHVHDVWVINLQSVVTHITLDSTGLVVAEPGTDNTAPVITLSGANPLTLSAGSNYVEPGYTAYDNVDGSLTGAVTVTGSVNGATPGNYSLTYTVTDAAGNTGTATRVVTVVDTGAPSLTLLGSNPLTMIQGANYVEPGFTATDAVDGNISAQVQVTGSVDNLTPGTYNLNYVVSDAAGNQASAVRTVIVQQAAGDAIPNAFLLHSRQNQPRQTQIESNPVMVTGVDPMTDIPVTIDGQGFPQYAVSTDAGFTWGGWTSTTTNVRLDYLIKVRHTTSPYSLTSTTSTLTIGGVSAAFVSTTKEGDTTKPVITLLGSDVQLTQGEAYVEPGYAATDDTDGDLTGAVVVTGTVDTNEVGLYVLTYTVQDAEGNSATATRLVYVAPDVTPPVITLIGGNMAVAVDDEWTEPGFTATDSLDGDLTHLVTVTGTVDTAVPGYYSLTYRVTDFDGNSATATRVVRVGTGTVFAGGTDTRSIARPIATPI